MDTPPFDFEDRGDIAIINFHPREGLFTADARSMIDMWEALEGLQVKRKQVILIRTPRDFLSPQRLDDFWRRASKAPVGHLPVRGGARAAPQMVAAADASVKRTLKALNSTRALTIGSCQGQIDFDLLGLLLACKYRMCTTDTVFINNTLKRDSPPGSGTPWFLTKVLGKAKVQQLYLNGTSLTAQEAFDIGFVDYVAEESSIEQEGVAIAERFAGYDWEATGSMMKALQVVDLDLDTYLETAGTGF